MILRPFQSNAINTLRFNQHLILTAPTGSGKSQVIYVSHIQHFRRTLLISPLIALSRQHSHELRKIGISVFGKHYSNFPTPTGTQTGVWIISPESIPSQIEKILDWGPDFIAVDEAHCIWEWGEDFRSEFKLVLDLPRKLPLAKTLWCSATLHQDARNQIQESLLMPAIQQGSFEIPKNIEIHVEKLPIIERLQKIYETVLDNPHGTTLLFAPTRALAEHLGAWAKKNNISALVYHAGLSSEERTNMENKILLQPPRMVIATSAFGMGVNFTFINIVILVQPTFSLLSMAQALGRAGRSGQDARAYVYWHPEDFYEFSWATKDSMEKGLALAQVEAWCRSESCKLALIENFFMETKPVDDSNACDRCNSCVNLVPWQSGIHPKH